jgi:hypothetical protein
LLTLTRRERKIEHFDILRERSLLRFRVVR